ncbi:hypothetical protein L1887_61689 [Cichorium endivia]|nr:hypothetical protein L1887_61689 [Cichorium endivia]
MPSAAIKVLASAHERMRSELAVTVGGAIQQVAFELCRGHDGRKAEKPTTEAPRGPKPCCATEVTESALAFCSANPRGPEG